MHKRSVLVGFGLGLLLAGFMGMMFNGHNRWHDRYDAPVISESGGRSADQVVYHHSSGYVHHGVGMIVPFFMMAMLCFVPLVFLSVMFKVMHRIRHKMHRRWQHGHHGAPTYYV